MDENNNIEEGFSSPSSFTKKTVVSLIVLVVLLIGVGAGVYLVQNQQIFRSKAAEIKKIVSKDQKKFKGYIVEFKDPPLVEQKIQAEKSPGLKPQSIGSYEQNTLLPNHEKAKQDILSRINQKIKTQVSAAPSGNKPYSVQSVPLIGQSLQYNVLINNVPRITQEYYRVFNGVELQADEFFIEEVKKSPYVKAVYPNYEVKAYLSQSVPLINADKAWTLKDSQLRNVTGEGINVAIIDTGIDYSHEDLGNSPVVKVNYDQITEPLKFWNGVSPAINQRISLNNNRLAYLNEGRINLYSFQDKSTISINMPNDNLIPHRLILEDNIIVYSATDLSKYISIPFGPDGETRVYTEAGVYYLDLNTQNHHKLANTTLISSLDIDKGRIVYKTYWNDNTKGIHVYDTHTQNDQIIDSSDNLLAEAYISNNLVVYTALNEEGELYGCPRCGKIIIYNLENNEKQEVVPDTLGGVLDFDGEKILYAGYFYGGVFEYSLNTQTHRRIDTTLAGNVNKQDDYDDYGDDIVLEYGQGSNGQLEAGLVYYYSGYDSGVINVFNNSNSKIVSINPLKFANSFDAEGNKICFVGNDYKIYCHVFNPEGNYSGLISFNDKVIGGYNFFADNGNPFDDNGHGTHVAATVAGNGVLRGVAPGAKLLAYKVLGSDGSGYLSSIIAALDKAIQTRLDSDPSNDIHVANLSLGVNCADYGGFSNDCGPDDPVSRAVDNAVNAGVSVVVAAGNSGPGSQTVGSPGTARNAITVGAVDKNKQMASFSSRGPVVWAGQTLNKPDIVAPGMFICAARQFEFTPWTYNSAYSLCNGDDKHVNLHGTSMATPHVAGTVALIKQKYPAWSPQEIKEMIVAKANNLSFNINDQGSGLVNVLNTLTTPLAASYQATTPVKWGTGETKTYDITVTNDGTETWKAGGANPMKLGVNFGSSNDTPGVDWFLDQRFPLPYDLKPGESYTFKSLPIKAPDKLGDYVLRYRMLKTAVAWFDQIKKTEVSVTKSLKALYMPLLRTMEWEIGQIQEIEMAVSNTGTEIWRSGGSTPIKLGVSFGSTNDTPGADWATDQRFVISSDVSPDHYYDFSDLILQVPNKPGNYVLRFRMLKTTVGWFDDFLKYEVTVLAPKASYNTYNLVNEKWKSGQTKNVEVQVTNLGKIKWDASGPNRVRLGVHFGSSNDTPGVDWFLDQRFDLPHDIYPKQSYKFQSLAVQVPTKPGNYVLRFRMLKTAVAWFDQIEKINVNVEAVPALSASYQSSPPTSWSASETKTYDYDITVTNTGSETWKAGGANPMKLGVNFGSSNDTPGVDWFLDQRFPLPYDLAPGMSYVFRNLAIKAPTKPGEYILRHRMLKTAAAWFDQIQKTNVTVK